MFRQSALAVTFALLALVSNTCAAPIIIDNLQGCAGRSGYANVTGCAGGMQLQIRGGQLNVLDYQFDAAVGVGSIYYTCDVLTATPQQINCTLPNVQFAGAAFLPVFIFNRTTGTPITHMGAVGLQYELPVARSSTASYPWWWSSSSSSSSSSAAPVPHISSIFGGYCSSMSSSGLTSGCTTNSPTLFTIYGKGFNAPSNSQLVQLLSSTTRLLYYCGTSQITDSAIVCMDMMPALPTRDSNALYQVNVVNVNGQSNSWWVEINNDGPYGPDSPSSDTSIAGMNFVTFIAVISTVGVLAVVLLSLAVLKCCCGVSPSSLCCRSRATRSTTYSSVAVPAGSAALLVSPPPAYAVDAVLPYASSSSRFGLSLPPNPSNYPAVSVRDGGY